MSRAGYKDVVDENGALVPPTAPAPPRPFEVVEEMYGMIWDLAVAVSELQGTILGESDAPIDHIKEAQANYRRGLELSPTARYGATDA